MVSWITCYLVLWLSFFGSRSLALVPWLWLSGAVRPSSLAGFHLQSTDIFSLVAMYDGGSNNDNINLVVVAATDERVAILIRGSGAIVEADKVCLQYLNSLINILVMIA